MLTFKLGCELPRSTQLAGGGAGCGAEVSDRGAMLCRNAPLVQVACEIYTGLRMFDSVTLILEVGQPSTP